MRKIVGITVGTTMNPKKIAENFPGGGSSLPAVTEEDNGKILVVKDGKWEKDNLPTYDGSFVVTPSADNDQTLLTSGKYNESDIKVEKIPYAEVSNPAGGVTVIIG